MSSSTSASGNGTPAGKTDLETLKNDVKALRADLAALLKDTGAIAAEQAKAAAARGRAMAEDAGEKAVEYRELCPLAIISEQTWADFLLPGRASDEGPKM